jgi:hypothetical protein
MRAGSLEVKQATAQVKMERIVGEEKASKLS